MTPSVKPGVAGLSFLLYEAAGRRFDDIIQACSRRCSVYRALGHSAFGPALARSTRLWSVSARLFRARRHAGRPNGAHSEPQVTPNKIPARVAVLSEIARVARVYVWQIARRSRSCRSLVVCKRAHVSGTPYQPAARPPTLLGLATNKAMLIDG